MLSVCRLVRGLRCARARSTHCRTRGAHALLRVCNRAQLPGHKVPSDNRYDI